MKAMLLAAGFGTRLRPVTHTLPKPLVPICNRPLIGWAVEAFLRAGVRELIVNLHHLPAPIEQFLTARYGGEATFHFSHEPEILGTGGGVRKVRPLLEHEDDFFLVNADTIQFPRYDALRDARRGHNALAALTLRHPPEGDRFTAVYLDGGRVTGFGRGTGEPLMFSGSHCISSRIFRYLPDKDFSGIVDECYQPAIDGGAEEVAGVVDDGVWFDIGTPERALAASRALLEMTLRGEVDLVPESAIRSTSVVDRTATIRGEVQRSSIGARSIIDGTVRDSAVWDRCRIGAGVTLDTCIVAHGVTIEGPAELSHRLITNDGEITLAGIR